METPSVNNYLETVLPTNVHL